MANKECKHERDFQFQIDVGDMEGEKGMLLVELKGRCVDCGAVLRFPGPVDYTEGLPVASARGHQIRLPVTASLPAEAWEWGSRTGEWTMTGLARGRRLKIEAMQLIISILAKECGMGENDLLYLLEKAETFSAELISGSPMERPEKPAQRPTTASASGLPDS